jgi:hypothetical protein
MAEEEVRNEPEQESEPLALPPPTPAAPRPRRDRERLAWLILVLLVVLVLVGSAPFWAPALASLLPWSPQTQVTAALAPIEARLDEAGRRQAALERHIEQIDEQAQAVRGGAVDADALAQRIAALEDRIAALEQRPRGGDPAEIAAIQEELRHHAQAQSENAERIARLEARPNAAAGARNDAALLLALGQLRAQLATSQPFATELGAVAALGHHDPAVHDAVEPLSAIAAKGIPSVAVLAQRFQQQVVPAALHEADAPEDNGWGAWMWAKLKGLVSIRSVGQAGAASRDPTEAALARAETALRANDLAGAVDAAASLPTAAATGWLAAARERLAAEQAIARVTSAVTARLAEVDRAGAAAER